MHNQSRSNGRKHNGAIENTLGQGFGKNPATAVRDLVAVKQQLKFRMQCTLAGQWYNAIDILVNQKVKKPNDVLGKPLTTDSPMGDVHILYATLPSEVRPFDDSNAKREQFSVVKSVTVDKARLKPDEFYYVWMVRPTRAGVWMERFALEEIPFSERTADETLAGITHTCTPDGMGVRSSFPPIRSCHNPKWLEQLTTLTGMNWAVDTQIFYRSYQSLPLGLFTEQRDVIKNERWYMSQNNPDLVASSDDDLYTAGAFGGIAIDPFKMEVTDNISRTMEKVLAVKAPTPKIELRELVEV